MATHAKAIGVSATFRNPAVPFTNGRTRAIFGPMVAPNSPSMRLPLNGIAPDGKSDGYHVRSASTLIMGNGFHVRRPPTPRSVPLNSLHAADEK